MPEKKPPYIINHGPYFRGSRSTMGLVFAIISLISVIFTIPLLLSAFFIVALVPFVILLACLAIGISVFLGIEGVEFDFERGEARYYRKYLWKKYGHWTPLSQYHLLTLDMESFSYNSATPTGLHRGKHRTFDVYLEGKNKQFDLYLAECMSHREGQQTLIRLSKELGFPMKDLFQEKLASAPKNRRR